MLSVLMLLLPMAFTAAHIGRLFGALVLSLGLQWSRLLLVSGIMLRQCWQLFTRGSGFRRQQQRAARG